MLTALARESVVAYGRMPGGFDAVGGLEIRASGDDETRAFLRKRLMLGGLGLEAMIVETINTGYYELAI